jgi:hypothetical protein
LDVMNYIYNRLHMKPLPLYAVLCVYLKEFAASKSEKKKSKYRIPEEQFRVPLSSSKLLHPVPEEPSKAIEAFDKGKAEAKIMFPSEAVAQEVTLSSFKIVKKLGEGNFGKAWFRIVLHS